jgi:uncharacterized protein involved in exopolysaccharide biosynthesis
MDSRSEINLTEIGAILKRRIHLFLIVVFVVMLGVIVVSLFLPPVYKASTKVIIQNETNLYPSGIIPSTADDKMFLSTQKEIMLSNYNIKAALDELKEKGLMRRYNVEQLAKKVKGDYVPDSNMLGVDVYLSNPKEAAEVANALTRSFIGYHSSAKTELVDRGLDIIGKETASLQEQIEVVKTRLENFKDKEQLTFYQAQIPYYVSNKLDINKRNIMTEAEIERMKEELAKTNAAIENGGNLDSFYPLTSSIGGQGTVESPTASLTSIPWMQDVKKKLSDAQTNLSRLVAGYTDNHPEVKEVRNQIVYLQDSLDEEMKKILLAYVNYYSGYIQFLESQQKMNLAEVADNEAQLQQISGNIEQAASRQIEYNMLLKQADILQNLYGVFLQKQNDLITFKEQFARSHLPNIKVFEWASIPTSPVFPNLPVNLAVGLCFGVLLGIAGCLIEEKKDSVKGPSPQAVGAERRSMSRIKKSLAVLYEIKDDVVQAKDKSIAENISGCGINIKIKEYIPKGTDISLKIYFNDKDFIQAVGKAAWIAPSDKSGLYDVGLHFVKIEPGEREKLINYLYGEHYLTERV